MAEDHLRVLNVRTGSHYDAHWPMELGVDPVARSRWRTKQMVYLGRYGHQDMNQWWSKDSGFLDECFEELVEIVKQENALVNLRENN